MGLGLVGILGMEGLGNLPASPPCRWSWGPCRPDFSLPPDCPPALPSITVPSSSPSPTSPPRLGRWPGLGWEGLGVRGISSQVTGLECGQPPGSKAEASPGAQGVNVSISVSIRESVVGEGQVAPPFSEGVVTSEVGSRLGAGKHVPGCLPGLSGALGLPWRGREASCCHRH